MTLSATLKVGSGGFARAALCFLLAWRRDPVACSEGTCAARKDRARSAVTVLMQQVWRRRREAATNYGRAFSRQSPALQKQVFDAVLVLPA